MKNNPDTVRQCYYQDTGEPPERDYRLYMDWCEGHVKIWKARVEAMGYSWPCWCVGNVSTGTQTYHEWLKERVGL